MFNRLERWNSSILGLISGLMIGVLVVSLYFIYYFNLGIFQFLPPIILAIAASVLMFIHIFVKFSSTLSNFFSGIIIVLAALVTYIDFMDQLNSNTGIMLLVFSVFLTILSFFAIVFLMKALEIKMLTEPQPVPSEKKEMPLKMEKKQKEHPKPPMDRL